MASCAALRVCVHPPPRCAQACPHLQSLDLGGCKRLVTDVGLNAIARHCQGLRSINLRFCEHVTDEGVLAVQQACINVQVRR